MSVGSIRSIKVPNGFTFNLEEAVDISAVRKEKTFCQVDHMRFRGIRYALKTIHKKQVPESRFQEQYRRLANEIRILYALDHPNVIKLYYHQQTEDEIRLLMEYGGVRLKSNFKKTFHAEDEVKIITKQILEALKYVHDEGYIHRDLEPENILINSQEQRIKIIDFGFIDEVGFRKTTIGSFFYMAPEITGEKTYNQKVDIWSLGIIVYQMLHQSLPFCPPGKDIEQIVFETVFKENRRKLNIVFDSQISETAASFIKRMLVLDPEMRANAAQLLRHAFIEPEDDLSIFDREGTDKTHKYQYNRQKSEVKVEEEGIEDLQGHLKESIGEVFACLHHQKETLGEVFKTYRQLLTMRIEDKQRRH